MKSVSDNKGITLIVLIITIIVLLIIAGISMSGGIQGIDKVDENRMVTEFEKVQHAVTERYTKYELLKDTSLLVGTKVDLTELTDVPESVNWKVLQVTTGDTVSTHPERKYYRLSKSDLENLGLTGDYNAASYIVNYYSGETYDENQKQTPSGKVLYKTVIENEASELGDDIIRDGLQVWYDAINNTGSGHSSNTTVWKDLSGNNNDGKLKNFNFPSTDNNGWKSNNLIFNGSSTWVNMVKYNPTNKVSLETNLSFNEIKNGEADIISNFESGGLGLNLQSGKAGLAVFINGDWRVARFNNVLDVNKEYHLTGTYDGTILKFYINGEEKASYTISGNIGVPNNNTYWAIGASSTGPTMADGCYTNMKINSARIYNHALTAEEVRHNYIFDKARYGI